MNQLFITSLLSWIMYLLILFRALMGTSSSLNLWKNDSVEKNFKLLFVKLLILLAILLNNWWVVHDILWHVTLVVFHEELEIINNLIHFIVLFGLLYFIPESFQDELIILSYIDTILRILVVNEKTIQQCHTFIWTFIPHVVKNRVLLYICLLIILTIVLLFHPFYLSGLLVYNWSTCWLFTLLGLQLFCFLEIFLITKP